MIFEFHPFLLKKRQINILLRLNDHKQLIWGEL